MKKQIIVITSLLMLFSLLAACAAPTPSPPVEQPQIEEEQPAPQTDEVAPPEAEEEPTGPMGKLVVAQGVDVGSLDPAQRHAISEFNVYMHIFDPILVLDENYQLAPMLASSWENIDETTIELKLRDDVTFHNGEPFTSEAVKLAFDRIIDDPESPQHTFLTGFLSPEIIDDYTVRIKTEVPMASAISILAWMLPLPPRYLEEVGDEGFSISPVGTGPFKFVSWVKDSELVLEANSNYWRGAPDVGTLVFRPIPEATTRVAELQTGAVDLITNVAPNLWESLKSDPEVMVHKVASARYVFLGMNLKVDSPLRDKNVRYALNYAVDKGSIIQYILDGHGFPLAGPVTSVHFGYNSEVEPYTYNPEKAKNLLAEAGYPDGFKISFSAPQGRYLQDALVAQAITGQLEQIGIDVDLQIMEYGTYISQVRSGDVELYMLGWGIAPAGDPHYIYNSLFHSENGRYAFMDFPEIDSMIEEGATTMDRNEREQVYKELMALVNEEAPWIFLYQQEDLYATSSSLQGWTPDSHERIYMYGASVTQE